MVLRSICCIYKPAQELQDMYIYIYIYVIYITQLRGVYGEYTTRAPRYQPSASPQADILGLGLYIRHIHREAMVYIIYSIA